MSEKFVVSLISCVHDVPEWVLKKYKEAGIEFRHHECRTREDLQKYAGDADVLWFMSSQKGLVCKENMDIFKKAGCAIKCGSGTDNIDHDGYVKYNMNIGGGDEISFRYCLECGQLQGKFPLPKTTKDD